MIQRSVINKASKIRMPKFSNAFFSKLVQWLIEHYSTEATKWQMRLETFRKCRFKNSFPISVKYDVGSHWNCLMQAIQI